MKVSIHQKIRLLLHEGPATMSEIHDSLELGGGPVRVYRLVNSLYRLGHIEKTPGKVKSMKQLGRRWVVLWRLTPRGKAVLKRSMG